jgi:cobalamin biosynthesis protein CbiD
MEKGEKGFKTGQIRLLDRSRPDFGAAATAAIVTTTIDSSGVVSDSGDDELCDILSGVEFVAEVTEALLTCISITGVGPGPDRPGL